MRRSPLLVRGAHCSRRGGDAGVICGCDSCGLPRSGGGGVSQLLDVVRMGSNPSSQVSQIVPPISCVALRPGRRVWLWAGVSVLGRTVLSERRQEGSGLR